MNRWTWSPLRTALLSVAALVIALVSAVPAVASPGATRRPLRFAATSSTHGVNHFVLRRSGARLQLRDADTGTVLRTTMFARTSAVTVTGTNGRVDNTLTLDFSGGSLAVPGGIAYDGGHGGYNVLALRGGRFAREREIAHSPHSGTITLDRTTVHYADIAPINDTAPAASYTINGTAAAETINVANGPVVSGNQTTQVSSVGDTFELVNFANKVSVTINGNGGGDTFDLNSTLAAVGLTALTVNATSSSSSTFNVMAMPTAVSVSLVGGGTDTANIGTGSVQSILGPVAITDPPSFIAVNVNDAANASSSRFVTVASNGTTNTISGLDPSTITAKASDIASLSLNGGSAGNTFVVSGITGPIGSSTPVTLNTGTGVDSTFLQGISASAAVTIHGQNGNDGVAISNAGSVQAILGPVAVDNTGSVTNVVIDDSNDSTARTASLTSNGMTDTVAGLAPAAISVKAGDLGAFTVDGGSGGNTMSVSGLAATGAATLNTGTGADTTTLQPIAGIGVLNVNGQAGHDTVRLSGNLQELAGGVNVTNGASTALTIDDSADLTARAVTVSAAQVSGIAPAPISFSGVPTLEIDGGAPSDTFTVTPSATTTDTLVGGGAVPGTAPGNTLNLMAAGASSPALTGAAGPSGVQGAWSFGNRTPVNFSHMQSLSPTALSIADAATTIGGTGSAPLSFTASLLAPSAQPVSASYTTADGTATAASGAYQAATGTVSFPAGTTSQTIAVNALGQPVVRPAQTVTLALSAPVNAVLSRGAATGTITDTFTPTPAPTPATAPRLSQLRQTHASWRVGTALAVVSRSAPPRAVVGTTFSFSLNAAATVTLTFGQVEPGRIAHGRCGAPAKANRAGRKCSRTVPAGTLSVAGHPGRDQIAFQGRLSRTRKLVPGRYALLVTAANAVGHSPAGKLAFTVVP